MWKRDAMERESAACDVRVGRVPMLALWVPVLCGLTHCSLVLASGDVATPQWGAHQGHTSTTADVLKIGDFCPGVQYLLSQPSTNTTFLQVNVSECEVSQIEPTAHQGVVSGVCEDLTTFCLLHIEANKGLYVQAVLHRSAYWCEWKRWRTRIKVREHGEGFPVNPAVVLQCDLHSLEEIVVEHRALMIIENKNSPAISVSLQTIQSPNFIVKHTANSSGYLVMPYIMNSRNVGPFIVKWTVPSAQVVMISIKHSYDVSWNCFDKNQESTLYVHFFMPNVNLQFDVRLCCQCPDHRVRVLYVSYLQFGSEMFSNHFDHRFMTIYISAISTNNRHIQLPTGQINCSVHDYSDFQQHVDCNLKAECEDGRDETEHCAFSSPHCQGLVASHHKCFQLIFKKTVTANLAEFECQKIEGKRASIKTRKEQADFLHLFKNQHFFEVLVGIRADGKSMPFIYGKFRKWSDKTLIYTMTLFLEYRPYKPLRNFLPIYIYSMALIDSNDMKCQFLCEVRSQEEVIFSPSVSLTPVQRPVSSHTQQSLFVCQDRHITHLFLSCDSSCSKTTNPKPCAFINVSDVEDTALSLPHKTYQGSDVMFTCDADVTAVHYVFLCDFRQDCPDGSDESFCKHLSCPGSPCSNGQCVSSGQHCNQYSDCLDDSDESSCPDDLSFVVSSHNNDRKQWIYVDLDGTGYFTQQVMSADQSCPDSHYQCKTESLYCLPVYTRCNGFSDCVHGEDEQGCDTVMCPGFYQCRSSPVCVHGDHLCDGWGQCPQRDDELMCDFACPEGCLCQGYAFHCKTRFPSDLYPQLRYLDATDSNMSLADFDRNIYLVHLRLSQCFLHNISHSRLFNLIYLDLAANYIKSVNVSVFLRLTHLRTVYLQHNPLSRLESQMLNHVHYTLRQVHVSHTYLNMLDTSVSLYLPQGEVLNVSYCAITAIRQPGLQNLPRLRQLDMSGNPITSFPLDLLLRSQQIEHIVSSNFRLCCKNLLPKRSNHISCVTPQVVLPSCTKLIPGELYRAFFWLIGTLAILGNFLCFLMSPAISKLCGAGFVKLIAQLQFAQLFMGIHVSIVVSANHILYGDYIHVEKAWTDSAMCKLAGFLSFLAGVVSVLIICFITMYHVTIFWCPGQSWRLSKYSTATACVVVWIFGFLMAAVPFLPGLSHWGLQGQSGLCRLALFDGDPSGQHFRWFTVTEAVNCSCCVMMVAGQAVIYRRTPQYRVTLHPTQAAAFPAVHVVRKLAVTEAACWIALALAALLRSHGLAVFDQSHDTLVVFVLPFNSALHPLLSLWTARAQRQQQQLEDKVIEVLRLRLAQPGKTTPHSIGQH